MQDLRSLVEDARFDPGKVSEVFDEELEEGVAAMNATEAIDQLIEMWEGRGMRRIDARYVLMLVQHTTPCCYCQMETRRMCVLCEQPVCGRCDGQHERECA